MTDRIVIVGGPRTGKSWLSIKLAMLTTEGDGPLGTAPIFCGDPLSTVKDPLPLVTYLPEGIPFSGDDGAAQWICDHWFSMPGPWICEGHVMARALRRWMAGDDGDQPPFPCEKVIVFEHQRPEIELKRGQVSMHKSVITVWNDIRFYYDPITEYR